MVAADSEVMEQMRRLCIRCARKLTPQSTRRHCGPCLRQNREDAVTVERPTLEEIAEMTAEIRRKWSYRTHLLRAGMACQMSVVAATLFDGERRR